MTSGSRRNELQALMFDKKYCIFAPFGALIKLSFNPIRKNQRASETNAPLIIPAIHTGIEQFGHPNCPVSKDPKVRKGRLYMFILYPKGG
jgi:hypothetical protein